jgi:hypothetical protein
MKCVVCTIIFMCSIIMAFIWLQAPSASQIPIAADIAYACNLSEIHTVLNIPLNIMNIVNNIVRTPSTSLSYPKRHIGQNQFLCREI